MCDLIAAPASVYVAVSVDTATDAEAATGGRREVTTCGLRTPAAPPPSRTLPISRGDGARCSASLLVRYYSPGTDVNFQKLIFTRNFIFFYIRPEYLTLKNERANVYDNIYFKMC